MKNFVKLFGIIVLAVAIGFSFAACYNAGDDGGGGGGSGGGGGGGGGSSSSLVGTWTLDSWAGYEMTIFSNGTAEVRVNGNLMDRGTITTSGNSYSLTSDILMGGAVVEAGTYSINGNKLTMINTGPNPGTNIYTRKN